MNERLNDALAALAEKLGVGVDAIWPILLKQARVDAVVDCCLAVVFAGVVVFGAYCVRLCSRALKNDRYSEAGMGWGVAAFLCLVIGSIATLVYSVDGIKGLLNPEYVALSKILRIVR